MGIRQSDSDKYLKNREIKKQEGRVIWITGLSSSGKTTLGRALSAEVRKNSPAVIHLDGDDFRSVMGNDLKHSPEDRLANAYRISRLCRYLSEQGMTVICSTMSLYPEIWDWNRKEISNYFQIYLKVNLSTLKARDAKGLYAQAERGLVSNVIGVDLPFNEPVDSDLVLDNDGNTLQNLNQNVRWVMEVSGLEESCLALA